MKLYFIRHAPVLGKEGFIYGDEAEVDLSGQEESILWLSRTLPSPDIADWYSSGVDRAKKSGEAVLRRMTPSPDTTSNMRLHAGFREQDFGSLIGKAHDAVLAHVQFVKGKIHSPKPPQGESISNLIIRVAKAIDEVRETAERNSKQNIVVFCHGGSIRAAHVAIKHLSVDDYIALDTPPLSMHAYDV